MNLRTVKASIGWLTGGLSIEFYRRTVAQDLGYAAHDLGGIVANSDNAVSSELIRMPDH